MIGKSWEHACLFETPRRRGRTEKAYNAIITKSRKLLKALEVGQEFQMLKVQPMFSEDQVNFGLVVSLPAVVIKRWGEKSKAGQEVTISGTRFGKFIVKSKPMKVPWPQRK